MGKVSWLRVEVLEGIKCYCVVRRVCVKADILARFVEAESRASSAQCPCVFCPCDGSTWQCGVCICTVRMGPRSFHCARWEQTRHFTGITDTITVQRANTTHWLWNVGWAWKRCSSLPTHLMSTSRAPSFCFPRRLVLLAVPAEQISPGDWMGGSDDWELWVPVPQGTMRNSSCPVQSSFRFY